MLSMQEMGGYENWNKHFTFLCSLVWPLIVTRHFNQPCGKLPSMISGGHVLASKESYWLVLELWLISSLNLQFNAEVLS